MKTVTQGEVSEHELIRMMVGREITNVFPKRTVEIGEPVLTVENLCAERAFRNISFEARRGEIFGIGGLVGAHRTEVLEALFGVRPITGGKVYLHGRPFTPHNPRDAIRHRIAFVTEDRRKSGLVLCLPVMENLNLINAQRGGTFGYLKWKSLQKVAQKLQGSLGIKLKSLGQLVSTLSGGNQQKVVLGKWLEFDPAVVLFDEPTRGIDVGAKTEIYSLMGELAARGAAVVMVSSELSELVSVTDRIMVMREGEMTGTLERKDATQERIMSLAALRTADVHPGGTEGNAS